MNETSKLFKKRKKNGVFEKYLKGKGLDIGCGSDCLKILGGEVIGLDLPNGSDYRLKYPDNTFNFVYSSHCLEHFDNPQDVLTEWIRVVKKSGYVYIAVPDFNLYEKNIIPSKFNSAHKSFFRLGKGRAPKGVINIKSFLGNIDNALVEFITLEDNNFDYSLDKSIDQTRGEASAQIEFCLQKLEE